jgi:Tfp pilus assembly protein PilX
MKKTQHDSKGQALLLIIVVLFIVFFLVITVSQNISQDSVHTIQNQNVKKALTAAQTGVQTAENYIGQVNQGSKPAVPTTGYPGNCTFGSGSVQYQCNYVITPQTSIDEYVTPDQVVQLNVAGAQDFNISYDDDSSMLVINATDVTNSHFTCIYYPDWANSSPKVTYKGYSSFTAYWKSVSGTDLTTTGNGSQLQPCAPGGAPANQYANNGLESLMKNAGNNLMYTLPSTGTTKFGDSFSGGVLQNTTNLQIVRLSFLNYTGNKIHIKASVNYAGGNTPVVQQYQVTSTGYYAGSRRIVQSYISKAGNPPGIFDYVLFNGGNSAISF